MIIFIAPNPWRVSSRNGYLQRVASIDEFFDCEKTYYEDLDSDPQQLAKALNDASMIYVHSVYQAANIIDLYSLYGHKIVTDLHGVVPEEEAMAGHQEKYEYISKIEKEVFNKSRNFVCVSDSMRSYYEKKYDLAQDEKKWVYLPIFQKEQALSGKKINTQNAHNVIYAGGVGVWQNTDIMIQTIKTTSDLYNYTILTHDIDRFREVSKIAKVTAVSNDEVRNYYRDNSLGFVLRDDNIVNWVACPTKLIEYIRDGVVPVVLSSKIGDFEYHGYMYVKLEEFTKRPLTVSQMNKMIRHNKTVFDSIYTKAEDGKKLLFSIYDELKESKGADDNPSLLAIENVILKQNIKNLQYEAESYKSLSETYETTKKQLVEVSEKLTKANDAIDRRDSEIVLLKNNLGNSYAYLAKKAWYKLKGRIEK